MIPLKVFFDIRDGYSDSDIMARNGITNHQLWRAKLRYEKQMGVALPRKRRLAVG